MMRPASPSPSTIGGIEARRCLFTSLHVTRVGAEHFLGGTMIRRPLWRQPRMAPPLASTMKLTRKLKKRVPQEVYKLYLDWLLINAQMLSLLTMSLMRKKHIDITVRRNYIYGTIQDIYSNQHKSADISFMIPALLSFSSIVKIQSTWNLICKPGKQQGRHWMRLFLIRRGAYSNSEILHIFRQCSSLKQSDLHRDKIDLLGKCLVNKTCTQVMH